MRKILIVIMLVLVIFSGCSSRKDLEKVTVLLDYTPNTNHSGMYLALDKGYYEEQGLDVEIIQPSAGSTESLVASGDVDFGISYGENVAQFNDQNKEQIISIYAILSQNTSGFAAFSDKNINEISDFKGKTYCGWGSDVENALLNVFLKQGGLSIEDINITTTSLDFINSPDECDFMWIYEGWDGIKLQQENLDYSYFAFSDYNIDWYTPVIITKQDLDKDLTQKFIDATVKGYKDASEEPQVASETFVTYNPEYDFDFIESSQEYVSEYYQVDGYQDPEIWNKFITLLKDNNVVSKDLITESMYTNDFN